jgi:hypothetical protein
MAAALRQQLQKRAQNDGRNGQQEDREQDQEELLKSVRQRPKTFPYHFYPSDHEPPPVSAGTPILWAVPHAIQEEPIMSGKKCQDTM